MPRWQLSIDDRQPGQTPTHLEIQLPSEETTPRELIRAYVYERVKDLEQKSGVSLTGASWTVRADLAIEAFMAGSILLLVDERSVEGLDEPIGLRVTSKVEFVRLTPLKGG